MLIRLVIENLFFFGDRKEFIVILNSKLKILNYYKYDFNGFELFKMVFIYGVNGVGKLNLIKLFDFF